jgi:hypothetical protein
MTEPILWPELYRAAMVELDPIKLRQRIEEAHEAIQRYREEINSSNPAGSAEEHQQMADALDNLRALLKIEFKSPSRTADADRSSERAAV